MRHRPILLITFFFILGILLQKSLRIPFSVLCFSQMLLMAIGFLFINRPRLSSLAVSFVFFLLGAIFWAATQTMSTLDVSRISWFERRDPIAVEGVIISDIQTKKFYHSRKMSFVLDVKRFQTKRGWRRRTGRILVNVFNACPLRYGDYVLLKGKLYRPFNFASEGKFSYRNYLKQKNISLILSVKKENVPIVLSPGHGQTGKAMALKVRGWLKEILADRLTENEAGILQAVLLGDRTHIPRHVRELFVRTGTAHILPTTSGKKYCLAFQVGNASFASTYEEEAIEGKLYQYLCGIVSPRGKKVGKRR